MAAYSDPAGPPPWANDTFTFHPPMDEIPPSDMIAQAQELGIAPDEMVRRYNEAKWRQNAPVGVDEPLPAPPPTPAPVAEPEPEPVRRSRFGLRR